MRNKIKNLDLVRTSDIVGHLFDESIQESLEVVGQADFDQHRCNEMALWLTEMKIKVLTSNKDLVDYRSEHEN